MTISIRSAQNKNATTAFGSSGTGKIIQSFLTMEERVTILKVFKAVHSTYTIYFKEKDQNEVNEIKKRLGAYLKIITASKKTKIPKLKMEFFSCEGQRVVLEKMKQMKESILQVQTNVSPKYLIVARVQILNPKEEGFFLFSKYYFSAFLKGDNNKELRISIYGSPSAEDSPELEKDELTQLDSFKRLVHGQPCWFPTINSKESSVVKSGSWWKKNFNNISLVAV